MNQNDDTALMRAARTGDVPMVGLLLDRGASIDIVDRVRTYRWIVLRKIYPRGGKVGCCRKNDFEIMVERESKKEKRARNYV